MKKKTTILPKARTAEEIVAHLGMPATDEHLKIAQAAIDDATQLRTQIVSRMSGIKEHLQRFKSNIEKLGVSDIGQLVKEYIRGKREIRKIKTQLAETQTALIATSRMLSPDERATLSDTHQRALRRAKDAHPLDAKYGL